MCFRFINSVCLTFIFNWSVCVWLVTMRAMILCSSYNYLITDCTWHCVDEEHQEDNKNKQNYANDDVLLVISPDQMIQTLERIYKPGEGCVWSAKEEERRKEIKTFVKADPSISKATPLQNIYLSLKMTFNSWEPTKRFGENFCEFYLLSSHPSCPQALAPHTAKNEIPVHIS